MDKFLSEFNLTLKNSSKKIKMKRDYLPVLNKFKNRIRLIFGIINNKEYAICVVKIM